MCVDGQVDVTRAAVDVKSVLDFSLRQTTEMQRKKRNEKERKKKQ